MKNHKPFYEKFTQPRKEKTYTAGVHRARTAAAHNAFRSEPVARIKAASRIQSVQYQYGKPVFTLLNPDAKKILDAFPAILQRILPLNAKQMHKLPFHIQELFHELTDERARRKVHYMNNPMKLSAYMHYYLWWNLVRMVKVLQNISIDLPDNAVAADFGSGPLTFLCALWIAKPALRKKAVRWYCVDLSHKALTLGEELFLALCAYTGTADDCQYAQWEIKKVTGAFGCPLKEKAALITEANMFNEIFWNTPLSMEQLAQRTYQTLANYMQPNAAVLIIEPGIPLAGAFMSLLRTQLLEGGFTITAPCPHSCGCALPYSRTPYAQKGMPAAVHKWCHFTFETDDSPQELRRLSEAAHLGKERASLSFLYCKRAVQGRKGQPAAAVYTPVRVCSDIVLLPGHTIGRYACSEYGFLLLRTVNTPESPLYAAASGTELLLPKGCFDTKKKDEKTGALIADL